MNGIGESGGSGPSSSFSANDTAPSAADRAVRSVPQRGAATVPSAPVGRRRGRRRTWGLVVFLTLPAAIFGTATVAGAYGVGRLVAPPKPPCVAQVVAAPARGSFDVRVFNASGVDGAAASAAGLLRERGFRVKGVDNGSGVAEATAQITHGPQGLDQALLVAQQVPGAQLVDDGRSSTSVSVVLGTRYAGLVAVAPPPPPLPKDVTLNVYNTTYRSGLATDVARDLHDRGFEIDRRGNDPSHNYLPDATAAVRYGAKGEAAAKVVAAHVPGARLVRVSREGAEVDVVLGNAFTALTPASQVPPPPPAPPTPPAPTVTRPCSR